VSPRLRERRLVELGPAVAERVGVVALAALAAALPGTDPVTTILELVPLLGLYELSILMLRSGERRARRTVETIA
jgi:Sec-independent protein secretion pathway component TatC